MSIQTLSLVTAPSAYAPTGGTALAFASVGGAVAGSADLAVAADTDLRLRRTLKFKVKYPSVLVTAPNGYTQARASAMFILPKVLANGKITVNTAKVELGFDPETTTAERQQLCDIIAQTLTNANSRVVFTDLNVA